MDAMERAALEVFDEIPFQPEFQDFAQRIRLAVCPDLEGVARELFARAAGAIRPKALLAECGVEGRDGTAVRFGGARFHSRVLSANLAGVERVFPYIATCGREADESGLCGEDLLSMFWLDALKEMALYRAIEFLGSRLSARCGLDRLSSMNPGSGDADLWPIEQQEPLFSIFGDDCHRIGVTLTDSYLMIPNKTVSGIYFPTTIPFESCQLCTREACPRRRAPYRGSPAGHPG
jgi:hypothetical protein